MRRQLQPVVPPGVCGHLSRDGREGGLHLQQLHWEGRSVSEVKLPMNRSGLEERRLSEFSNKAPGAGFRTRLQMVLLVSLWDHFPELKTIFDTFVFSLDLFVVVEV